MYCTLHQSVCSPSPIYSNAGKVEKQLKVSGVVQARTSSRRVRLVLSTKLDVLAYEAVSYWREVAFSTSVSVCGRIGAETSRLLEVRKGVDKMPFVGVVWVMVSLSQQGARPNNELISLIDAHHQQPASSRNVLSDLFKSSQTILRSETPYSNHNIRYRLWTPYILSQPICECLGLPHRHRYRTTPDLEDVFTVLGMDLLCDHLVLILSWRIRKRISWKTLVDGWHGRPLFEAISICKQDCSTWRRTRSYFI